MIGPNFNLIKKKKVCYRKYVKRKGFSFINLRSPELACALPLTVSQPNELDNVICHNIVEMISSAW